MGYTSPHFILFFLYPQVRSHDDTVFVHSVYLGTDFKLLGLYPLTSASVKGLQKHETLKFRLPVPI